MVNQEQLEMMWSCKLLGQDWFDHWKGKKNSAEHIVLQACNMWATYEREKLQEPYWRHRKKEWFGLKSSQEEKNKHKVPHSSSDRENEGCYIYVGFERPVPMT